MTTAFDEICRGCDKPLLPENTNLSDGCPCNSRRGINHGLVDWNTCKCDWCDPDRAHPACPAHGKPLPMGPCACAALWSARDGLTLRRVIYFCAMLVLGVLWGYAVR